MFFEGSEKKAEVIVDENKICLLTNVSDTFWQELVECCNAKILSKISNQYCTAYLLSESSLFIWSDRILILTCGATRLVKSVEYFIKEIGSSKIKHINYQRKNEYFAKAQFSSFGEDIHLLNQYCTGNAYRFGDLDAHHNYIFHQNNNYQYSNADKSYELLAYQIGEQASQKLTSNGLLANDIRQFLQLDEILPGFLLDDFVFQPCGYSVNAIKDNNYLTIHITPQQGSSYISFAANINLIAFAPRLLKILQPKSFDLLSFNEFDFSDLINTHIPSEYVNVATVKDTLANNCNIAFANYTLPCTASTKPEALNLIEQSNAL